MHHSSPNVDHSAAHRERNIWATIHQHLSSAPMTDATLSASTRTPVPVVNSHKSGLSSSLRSPSTKAYQNRKYGNTYRLVNTPHAHSMKAWSQQSHPSLSGLRAKSRSFKIFQSNHMQHSCYLITVISILSGKHHKQTNTKSNDGRTERGQNKKGPASSAGYFRSY